MCKKLIKIGIIMLTIIIMLFLLASCTPPYEDFYNNDDNYITFIGKINSISFKDNYDPRLYLNIEIESQSNLFNNETDYLIIVSNYKELLRNDFDFSDMGKEYVFIVSKNRSSEDGFYSQIASIKDTDNNLFLIYEIGKKNLTYYANAHSYNYYSS